MRIVHIVEATATGTLSMLSTLANCQAVQHDVTVIYSRRPETPNDLSAWFAGNVRLEEVPMDGMVGKVVAAWKIRNLLKKINPAAIFLHSSFAGFVGRVASAALPISVFYIPHCISFMRKDIGGISRSIFVVLERIANMRPGVYVACSESEAHEIRCNIPGAKVTVIENAVDSKGIDKAVVAAEEHESLTVITVGQARPQKNPELFGLIAEKVRAVMPGVKFVWVGGAQGEAKARLLDRGVDVLGWATREAVFKLVKGSTLYLSTSAWEGMPVSLIEAQLAGTPVVATECAGNVDVIISSETGLLFRSAEEGCSAVLTMLKNERLRSACASKARKVAVDRFSVERYLTDFDRLLLRSISGALGQTNGAPSNVR